MTNPASQECSTRCCEQFVSGLRRHGLGVLAILFYIALSTWQINWYPGEVYPHWDNYWEDVLDIGRIETLGRALQLGELPAIDPYTEFGANHAGDLYSPWAPLHFLAPFLDARLILWLDSLLLIAIGGLGAYFYIHYFARDRFISLLAGLTFCSMWKMYGSLWYHTSVGSLFFVPLLLLTIHWVLTSSSVWSVLAVTFVATLAVVSQDTQALLVIPPLVASYTLIVAWGYHRLKFFVSVRRALVLLLLSIWGTAIYTVPLYANCLSISENLELLRQAVPTQVPASDGWIPGFGGGDTYAEAVTRAFAGMKRYGGLWEPLIFPTENPYNGANYLPVAFYLTVVFVTLAMACLFRKTRRQLVVVWALLALGLVMFIADYLYWSPFSKLAPFQPLREGTQSIVAVPFNLNIAAFANGLAPYLCFAAIVRSPSRGLKILLYTLILGVALAIDLYLFVLPGGPPATAPFLSSNRIQWDFGNVLHFFVAWNTLPVVLVIAHDVLRRTRGSVRRASFYIPLTAAALFVFVLGQSAYNEWSIRCGSGGRLNTRSDYRWKNFLKRDRCIDELTDRGDLNFRMLYCGVAGPHGSGGDARDWKTIAETELHTASGHKVLFSCRCYSHPYSALLRRLAFNSTGGLQRFQYHPPLTEKVAASIGTIKGILGLKYVVSVHQKIDSPHLIEVGQCDTDPYPEGLFTPHVLKRHYDEWVEAGPVYIYEVKDPTGIAFLAERYEMMSAPESLRALYENERQPWREGVVYLEEAPAVFVSDDPAEPQGGEEDASIVQESYNTTEVKVRALTPKLLVLSYVYRPFWQATINGEPQPIYRAYGGLLCVAVPAGESTVRFEYDPWDVYLGILLTLAALPGAWILRRIL